MKRSVGFLNLCLTVGLALCTSALAQNQPNIGFVYPAGGQRGSTITVTVGGQYLNGVKAAYITGEGVSAELIEHTKPMPRRIYNELGQKLRDLKLRRQKNEISTSKAEKEFTDFAKSKGVEEMNMAAYTELRAEQNDPKRQPNAQLEERVTWRLKVAEDAPLGDRELRLQTPKGLTNPLVIQIGQYTELNETEPNDQKADGQVRDQLPVIINGQVMPGDVDRFHIKAERGMRLVASVEARSLVPYLADAVPGWFQATLALTDANGDEVAFSDDHGFDPDPVVSCKIPADGDYILEIHDAIYRGREDFVYRITLGELPFLTSVYPMGGQAGEETDVKLSGWNLTSSRKTFNASEMQPGIKTFSVERKRRESNRLPFALDKLAEALEVEPNNQWNKAQLVKLPLIVNGRIGEPNDYDIYQFSGQKGQQVVAEVSARRLGSELDSIVKLTDLGGTLLASNDDFVDKGAGLTTHQADSQVIFTFPNDGTYQVHVGDTQKRGGHTFGYRLRISEPQPDFALRVVPSSVNALAGSHVPLTVYALRKDGFDGPIKLELVDMPEGFALGGGVIPAGQEMVQVTMAVPGKPRSEPLPLSIQGQADVGGGRIRRMAVAADDQMQAFLYRHLVPTQQGMVMVGGKARRLPDIKYTSQLPVKVAVGGTAKLQLVMPAWLTKQLTLELKDAPKGLAIKKLTPNKKGLLIEVVAQGEDIKPGVSGNLIFEGFQVRSRTSQNGKKSNRRSSIGFFPAAPFEITPATVAAWSPAKE